MGAITNPIKTEMSTYIITQADWAAATTAAKKTLAAMRLSDNTVVGTNEEIVSDVRLPGTRITDAPKKGTESSSGTLSCEFNVDEQDALLASVMCASWVDDPTQETGDVTDYKTLEPGSVKTEWRMVKKFAQTPAEYREYTGLQVDKLGIKMDLNSFVKMSFDVKGGNNPLAVSADPVDSTKYNYGTAMNTDTFSTLEGYFKIGDAFASLTPLRQSPSFSLDIANNKDSAGALFETESIEQSDGDFNVSGSFDIWKADAVAMTLLNAAIAGAEKCMEIQLESVSSTEKTTYTIQLRVNLEAPSEAKDGNRYKITVPYSMHRSDGIKFIKKVEELN